MTQTKCYTFDGMCMSIPVHYDRQAQMYIEDYPDLIENPVWTPSGYRVLFSGTDACAQAQGASPEDCGGCAHFQRVCETTLIGLCRHPQRQKKSPE